MTDLTEDIEPAKPHPAVDFALPPVEQAHVPRVLMVDISSGDGHALNQLSVLMKMTVPEVVHELIHRALPHPNGKAGYENTCTSCGRTYHSNRRALPGKRNYCPDCRKSGEPAADRARDYRDRKSKERQT